MKVAFHDRNNFPSKPILHFSVLLFFLTASIILFGVIKQDANLIYISFLFTLLGSYFCFQKKLNIFNPFTLFTFYYFTIPLSALYLYLSGFDKSPYLDSSLFGERIEALFQLSLIYYIIGYLFAWIGYEALSKKRKLVINLNDGIPFGATKWVIVLFMIIGLLNFAHNVLVFSAGNILHYMGNISTRKMEFTDTGGTTIGYMFSQVAMYLWLYRLLKLGKLSLYFIVFFLVNLIIVSSNGRVFSTIVYLLSFVSIYYVYSSQYRNLNNYRYALALIFSSLFGLVFYFFRIASSFAYNGMLDGNWIGSLADFIDIDSILYLLIAKGNIPNIPIFMKIINSWGSEVGYLYGQSFFSWIYQVVPSTYRPEGYQISAIVKNTWYSHLTGGGNLPPTGVGEMYANFGIIGPAVGMFAFGGLIAFIQNTLLKLQSYWYLVFYSNITLGFVLIYPKGEFDNISIWFVIPIGFAYALLRVVGFFQNTVKSPGN